MNECFGWFDLMNDLLCTVQYMRVGAVTITCQPVQGESARVWVIRGPKKNLVVMLRYENEPPFFKASSASQLKVGNTKDVKDHCQSQATCSTCTAETTAQATLQQHRMTGNADKTHLSPSTQALPITVGASTSQQITPKAEVNAVPKEQLFCTISDVSLNGVFEELQPTHILTSTILSQTEPHNGFRETFLTDENFVVSHETYRHVIEHHNPLLQPRATEISPCRVIKKGCKTYFDLSNAVPFMHPEATVSNCDFDFTEPLVQNDVTEQEYSPKECSVLLQQITKNHKNHTASNKHKKQMSKSAEVTGNKPLSVVAPMILPSCLPTATTVTTVNTATQVTVKPDPLADSSTIQLKTEPVDHSSLGEKTLVESNHANVQEQVKTAEKPYRCPHCEKTFATVAYLIIHKRIHTGERPYACTHCGKRFTRSSCLKIHETIHTGLRPYQCTQCEKKFSNKTYLKVHERNHTGEKPYTCPHCGKKFRQRWSLTRHQRLVHRSHK